MLSYCTLELRLGGAPIPVALLARDGVLVATLLDRDPGAARADFAARGELPAAPDRGPFRDFLAELCRYESGEMVAWRSPFRLEGGTPFQRRIWERIAEIPPGATQSYAELAALSGAPRRARAAGSACGRNPLPLRIPCHRVLAAGRALGGFTGLLDTKRRLLAHEGAEVRSFAGGGLLVSPAAPSLAFE